MHNVNNSHLPAKVPQMIVPQNGVFVFGSTLEKISNNNPSDAIEYNILGNGNNVPIILEMLKKNYFFCIKNVCILFLNIY